MSTLKTSKLVLTSVFALGSILYSCGNDDDNIAPVNEEEVINQVRLIFTDSSSNTTTYNWNEGQDGNTTITLAENENYSVDVEFYDTQGDEIENITEEVAEEFDEHFVTYNFLNNSVVLTRATDDVVNSEGEKIGLKTVWDTTNASTDTVQVRLVHEAEEDEEAGDAGQGGTTVGGETDVEVSFSITVE